jgi:predicted NUDIX family phosphoesterase
METDTAYRQVIPYLIVTYEDMVFITKRKDGDGRLIGKLSCGIGGHIELCDTTWTNSSILKEALKREIEEELVIDYNTQVKSCVPIGVLCCNETEVDKVHIGIVYNVEVTTFNIQVRETDTLEGGFIFKKHTLERLDENWETWSKLCLTKLIGGGYCG